MITPKTDWTAADYFNLADYNRITSNLNELASIMGVAAKAYAAADCKTLPTVEMRTAIADHFNALAAACKWNITIAASSPVWFDWKELNTMETLCSDATRLKLNATYGQGNVYGDGLNYGGGVFE